MNPYVAGILLALYAGHCYSQAAGSAAAMRQVEKELRSTDLLTDKIKTTISLSRDPDLNEALFDDLRRAKSQPTPEARRLFAIQSARNRLLLRRLSENAVPDDALQDVVPGFTNVTLRRISTARMSDSDLVKSLQAAFGKVEKFSFPDLKPSILSINPGTPLPNTLPPGQLPGGLTLPGSGYDPATNRRTDRVWRSGFSHVVALAPSAGNRRRIFCAGTLIATDWVLTAAHCLFDMSRNMPRATGTFSAYLPFHDRGLTLYSQEDEPNTGMVELQIDLVRWIGESGQHHPFPASKDALITEIDNGNDVVMLRVAKGSIRAPAYPRPVAVSKNLTATSPVTVVGYGLTNAVRIENSVMEVAVRKSSLHSSEYFLSTSASDAPGKNDARVCPFDSGAPVFEGELNGDPKQSHNIVGVVSGSTGKWDGTTTICFQGQQFITRLNRPNVLAWYCGVAAGACQ